MLLKEYLDRKWPRIIVADFDDTLIHWLDIDNQNADALTWDKQNIITQDWYNKHSDRYRVNKDMQKFMSLWRDEVEACYVLSWRDTSISLSSLTKLIDELYPKMFDDVLIAGTREAKIDVLTSLATAYSYSPHQILLIDDHPTTISECRKAGFKACNPGAIKCYLESSTD